MGGLPSIFMKLKSSNIVIHQTLWPKKFGLSVRIELTINGPIIYFAEYDSS